MKIQTGWRYRAVVLGDGEFEGVLGGPAGVDTWQERGGEVRMPRWQLHLDEGQVIEVQEAELGVMDAQRIGTAA